MIEHEQIAAKWWRWWANPFEGLHPNRFDQLELHGISPKEQHRYEAVARARRILGISSVPDDAMTESPDKLLTVLIDHETLCAGLAGLGCLALGDSILTARAQDWEDFHAVQDNDMIRDLVFSLRSLTPVLETIRLDILSSPRLTEVKALTVQEAVNIVLGLYFREFSLPLYKRWLLGISPDTEATLAGIPRINKEHVEEFHQWVDSRLDSLIDEFNSAQDLPMLDIDDLRDDYAETA